MGIVNRRFSYRDTIKVSPGDLDLARRGAKTCTIRLGVLDVKQRIVDLSDGKRSLKVAIQRIDSGVTFAKLTDIEARADGQPSKEALTVDLAQYYGQIDPAQPVTVIWFEVLENL